MNAPSSAKQSALALLASLAVGLVGLAGSTKLVKTPTGELFFADELNVFAVDVRTNRLELVLPLQSVTDLQVDAGGRLCGRQLHYDAARDVWRPVVWRYRGANQPVEIVPEGRNASFAFAETVDAAGNLYFWEGDRVEGFSRLLVRHRDGPVTLLAGHRWGARDGHGADAQLGNIGGITVGPDGSVYFCDGPSVRKVTPAGEVVTLASGGLLHGTATPKPEQPAANSLWFIAVDNVGFIYVAGRAAPRVLRISPGGKANLVGDAGARGWLPEGLASKDGIIYVAESRAGTVRVRRLDQFGETSGVAVNPARPDSSAPYRNSVWLSQCTDGAVSPPAMIALLRFIFAANS